MNVRSQATVACAYARKFKNKSITHSNVDSHSFRKSSCSPRKSQIPIFLNPAM